jgi:galactose oxidase-like protein
MDRRCLLPIFIVILVADLTGCASATASTSPSPSAARPGSVASAGASASVSPAAVENSVVELLPLSVPRAAHTATALPDGRILIAGGFGTETDGDSASTELFDPAKGRFEAGPRLTSPRYGHSATRLADGRVLMAGGFGPDGTVLATAELFDPVAGTFAPTGRLRVARADHEAVLLDDGRVVLIGGTADDFEVLASAEIFDPHTGAFSPSAAMTVPREGMAATRLPDGRVLVTGGHIGRHAQRTIYDSTETYDPATDRFAPAGTMKVARHKHDAILLGDGRVLLIAGSDARDDLGLYDSAETYDPTTDAFTAVGRLAHPRYKFRNASVLLPDGRVLAAGGASVPEVFDPAAAKFASVDGSFDRAPYFATAVLLDDGDVLLAGGYSDRGPASNEAWLIRP